MSWKGIARGLLFGAGMFASATAGHLFYLARYSQGAGMFALTALFLYFAMAEGERAPEDGSFSEEAEALRRSLADLALIVADEALNGAKRIGRTMPCTPAELSRLEEDLMYLLTSLRVEHGEKSRVARELESLRARYRQADGRRVLSERR